VLPIAQAGFTCQRDVRRVLCAQTGSLRILNDGILLREWFPPNSWIAIASISGIRHWGILPDSNELRALLENQMSLLNIGESSRISKQSFIDREG